MKVLIEKYRGQFKEASNKEEGARIYDNLLHEIQELSWIVRPDIRPNQYGWHQEYRKGELNKEKYFSLLTEAKEALNIVTEGGPFDSFISAL
tara:strand:- start:229 stop:504 length:276 start_codon:yes stop_codon:yes gene_type:complete